MNNIIIETNETARVIVALSGWLILLLSWHLCGFLKKSESRQKAKLGVETVIAITVIKISLTLLTVMFALAMGDKKLSLVNFRIFSLKHCAYASVCLAIVAVKVMYPDVVKLVFLEFVTNSVRAIKQGDRSK